MEVKWRKLNRSWYSLSAKSTKFSMKMSIDSSERLSGLLSWCYLAD